MDLCTAQLSQIIELVPTVPKLHRLRTVLKGCEYEEGHERDDDTASGNEDEGGEGERPVRSAFYDLGPV